MTPKSFIGKFLLCLCIEKGKLWLVVQLWMKYAIPHCIVPG